MGNFQCTFNLPTQLVCFFVSFGKKQFPKRTWPTDRQRPTNCLATTPLRYDSHKNSCRPPPPCKTGCSPNCQVLIRQKLGSPTAVSLPLGDRNSSHLYIRWKFSAQELRISEPAFWVSDSIERKTSLSGLSQGGSCFFPVLQMSVHLVWGRRLLLLRNLPADIYIFSLFSNGRTFSEHLKISVSGQKSSCTPYTSIFRWVGFLLLRNMAISESHQHPALLVHHLGRRCWSFLFFPFLIVATRLIEVFQTRTWPLLW